MTETRTCKRCGRAIEWRRKWADVWDSIQYCSDACRKTKPVKADSNLESAIISILSSRAGTATICPSEAARVVFPDTWRDEMERTRRAARRLVDAGLIEITQGGRVVEPSTAKGPIRLRKTRDFPAS